MILGLLGNQNCGKTTLFNALTGSNQHVGNFPGVTVDRKYGSVKNRKDCELVDMPGIYSMRAFSQEEIITREFLLNTKPDGIINIIDASAIERNLYLTLQLIELRIPMVIAVNMMDELRNNNGSIHIQELSARLGVPVIPISAAKNEGIDELIEIAYNTAKHHVTPTIIDFCGHGPVHRCIHAVSHLIEDHAESIGIPPRFAGVKLIEGDREIIDLLELDQNELELMEHSIIEMENETELDRNAAIADMRYNFITGVCAETVVKPSESKEHIRSRKIDAVLTGKYWAFPLFILIMLLVFWLSFDVIGAFLSGLLEKGIGALTGLADVGLQNYGINPVVKSLVIDGIFQGVGSVLSFLPVVVTLFFFLSLLEDSGYMARVAFVMDKPLRKIGLSGKSLVPMIIGFGCTVPAIMATRTLSSNRDKRLTMLLTPFISCSAKIPIYSLFAAAFFPRGYKGIFMICYYLLGILLAIAASLILSKTVFRGRPVPFVMELPNYRLPTAKNTWQLMWEKAKDFLERAFTVIFLASIVIWFLRSFDTRLMFVTDSKDSLLCLIGSVIAPVFRPCGFGDWRFTTALISGVMAKEAVVSTLGILIPGEGGLTAILPGVLSVPAALAYVAFVLLYTPCIAAIATVKREFNSFWKTACFVLGQCAVAWVVSCGVYQLGNLIASLAG